MKKRLICLAILLCMLIALLASCGATNSDNPKETTKDSDKTGESQSGINPGDETETGEETSFIADDVPTIDMNGFVFTVLHSNRGLLIIPDIDEFTGDIVQDAIYEAASYVKERFNINYERIVAGNDNEMATKVEASVLSSGTANEFSVSIGHDFLTVSNAMKGCYANLSNIETFNFSKPWWPANNLNSLSVGNKLYVASSYLSYSPIQGAAVEVFNKDYMKDLGIEEPYQKAFDKAWYMVDLIELAEAGYSDLDSNGTIDIDAGEKYGFVMGREGGYGTQRSMDVVPVLKDQDDVPYYGLDVERAYNFLDNLAMLFDYGKFFLEDNTSQNAAFGANAALFVHAGLSVVYKTLREYKDITYGFMPVPMLDELQEDFIAGATDMVWGIPQTSLEHVREISYIIEALSCQCYNYVVPAFYDMTMCKKLAESPNDKEVLDIVRDHTALSFAYFYTRALGGASIAMADLPRQTTAGELSSYVAKNSGTLQDNITILIEQYEQLDLLG